MIKKDFLKSGSGKCYSQLSFNYGKIICEYRSRILSFKKTWKYDKTAFFQRIGLQYQVTDRLFASLELMLTIFM
jgi:hypothetical protein